MIGAKMYDVVIAGAGPAGLTAAIYTCRKRLKTLVISKNIGGQVSITKDVENYPGVYQTTGYGLVEIMEGQAKKFGAEIRFGEIIDIEKKGKNYIVQTDHDKIETKAVVLAFGKTPRGLDVPGENKFKGRGVSYCTTCDGPLFEDRHVAVVGGGNSALESAIFMSKIASKVYLIHRREEFRGDECSVENVKETQNIELIMNAAPVEVKGDKFVHAFVVEDVNTKKRRDLAIDGIFVEIGYEVKTGFLKGLVDLDKSGQIKVNETCETNQPGIFAAGDVTNVPYKQIIIAAGEGATAGMSAYNYIQKSEGKPVMTGDWIK